MTGLVVLSEVDPTTNTAVLTIGLEECLDLESFTRPIANPGKLSVDGSGKIPYEVTAPSGKKFYRAGFQE